MSLQIWLPLNGDTHNQGLSDIQISGSPDTYENGILGGKCAVFSSETKSIVTSLPKNLKSIKNTTLMMFASQTTGAIGGISHNRDNTINATFTHLGGWQFSSTTKGWVYHGEDPTDDKWHHIACSIDNNYIYTYMDGVQTGVYGIDDIHTDITSENIFELGCDRPGAVEWFHGKICDVRLYDECLSSKQIHEISKGLYIHYPLNDVYNTNLCNRYKSSNDAPTQSSYSFYQLEDGYNYKLDFTNDSGENKWLWIEFAPVEYTVGKRYDFSCKIRIHELNFHLHFRAARFTNDWANARDVPNITGGWMEIHGGVIIPSDEIEWRGESVQASPRVEFCCETLNTKGYHYIADFDVKDVQVVEIADGDADYTKGDFATDEVQNTAGLSVNGALNSRPDCDMNSPRFDKSFFFNTQEFIQLPTFPLNMSSVTFAMWAKISEYNFWERLFDFAVASEGQSDSIGIGIAGSEDQYKHQICVYSRYYRTTTDAYTGIIPELDTWYHYAVTIKGDTMTFYLNGEKILSKTYPGEMANYEYKYNYIGKSNFHVDELLHGAVSDFRIYGTALSQKDVKELYDTPVVLSDKGDLITQSELKEK